MRRGLPCYVVSCVAVLAGLLMISPPAAAQKEQASEAGKDVRQPKPLPPGGLAPRTADGHPDLSGVWFPGSYGTGDLNAVGLDGNSGLVRRKFDPKKTPQEPVPFQPWAAAKYKEMFPTEAALEAQAPSVTCKPRGVPTMFLTSPYPIQLVQTPGQLLVLAELNVDFRLIPTDGRSHPKDPDPTFHGDSVAHWEGDTLVVDVIAIDDTTWNDLRGWFHSDQEHAVERFTRPSVNYLTYQVTIEDPKVLTKPWTSPPNTWTLGHEPLGELYCTNNQDDYQFKQLSKPDAK
jgi:hypothetical protein